MIPLMPDRQRSVDLLRALAIVLMVVVHFAENLSGWHGGAGGAFAGVHRSWWLPTGFAAPMFTFLSGLSYRLWQEAQRQRGLGDEAITKRTVRRGLFLIGLGFAFNVLIWLPEDVFNWDILTLIGLGLLVLAVARWVPDRAVLFSAAVIIAVSPALRLMADYAAFWTEGYFDYDFTVADVTLGWLVTGYFPVFPWLAFPLAGYALAPQVLGVRPITPDASPPGQAGGPVHSAAGMGRACSRPRFARPLVPEASAAALIAAAIALVIAWPSLPAAITGGATAAWTMFPATMAYVLGTLGGVLLALVLAHRLLDGQPDRGHRLMAWAAPLSRHALSIYLLHHAVHVWPLWAAGLVSAGDATAYWQLAMPVGQALALAGGFLLAAAVLFHSADRLGIPTAESLLRWICD